MDLSRTIGGGLGLVALLVFKSETRAGANFSKTLRKAPVLVFVPREASGDLPHRIILGECREGFMPTLEADGIAGLTGLHRG